MRFDRFLLTTCAAICLATPAVGLADPPQGHGQNPQADQKDNKPDRGAGAAQSAGPKVGQAHGPPPGAAAFQGGPKAPGAVNAPRVTQGQGFVQGERRGPQGAQAPRAGEFRRPDQSPAAGQGLVQGVQGGQHAPQGAQAPRWIQGRKPVQGSAGAGQVLVQGGAAANAPRPSAVRPPPAPRAPPALSGWNRNVRGQQRAEAGQQWRGQHRNWDQNAPWRGNHDWWRSYSSFRLFSGVRTGFFFFPDYGYIAAPQAYRDHHWQAGDYPPRWFWRYSVKDYASYGLPRPPNGCMWVWLNGDVALIDRSDGYILDIVEDLW